MIALSDHSPTYISVFLNRKPRTTLLWDVFKAVRRGKITATTSLIRKLRRQRLHSLEIELNHLLKYHIAMLDNRVKQEMKEIRNEAQKIGTQQIKKKHLFSKQMIL